MRALLIGLAASFAFAPTLASAQDRTAFASGPAFPVALDTPVQFVAPPGQFDGRHDRRRHRGRGGALYLGPWNSDFDGNRAFDPDRYHDWWHERPERAYPRWMQNNQNCERKWYAGDTLRC